MRQVRQRERGRGDEKTVSQVDGERPDAVRAALRDGDDRVGAPALSLVGDDRDGKRYALEVGEDAFAERSDDGAVVAPCAAQPPLDVARRHHLWAEHLRCELEVADSGRRPPVGEGRFGDDDDHGSSYHQLVLIQAYHGLLTDRAPGSTRV